LDSFDTGDTALHFSQYTAPITASYSTLPPIQQTEV
jgi:hypothetical protein